MSIFIPPISPKIAVIGLGYVGLPLAVALARSFDVIGFDINEKRLKELKEGYDSTNEISKEDLQKSSLSFSSQSDSLKECNLFIITVPTPVDSHNQPDLSLLLNASELVGRCLSSQNVVVYESTVYPGVTEEICGPCLEAASNLKIGEDFFLGYSPERINPGDKNHTLSTITKVVAGQTPEVTAFLLSIYGAINNGNTFPAKSIKVAEAAKVIENAQRDINIAFINEITQIFNKLNFSIHDVLDAAKTKWNFLPFTPGLVGGHCIGVDPFYLAKCSLDLGHRPDVILAGRHTNEIMALYVADRIHEILSSSPSKILFLGATFKENIPDIRNSKVFNIKKDLENKGHSVFMYDPLANTEEVKKAYSVDLLSDPLQQACYDLIFFAVPHEIFLQNSVEYWKKLLKKNGIVFDLKGLWRQSGFSELLPYYTL